MGFYIQDDYWDAVQDLPQSVQDAYFGSIVRLYYIGDTSEPTHKEAARCFKLSKIRVVKARQKALQKSAERTPKSSTNEATNTATHDATHLPTLEETKLSPSFLESESEIESKREREKKTTRRFSPPLPDQVNSFAAENGLSVDGQEFCDYYAAQGWKLSNGNPMKDWMAAARNWSRRDFRKGVKRNADAEQLGEYANAF